MPKKSKNFNQKNRLSSLLRMATAIRDGERRPHQNYNHHRNDDINTFTPPSPYPATFAPPPTPNPNSNASLPLAPGNISITDYLSSNLKIPLLNRRVLDPVIPDTRVGNDRVDNSIEPRILDPVVPSTSSASFGFQPRLPAQVDFRLLMSGVGNSIERMMRSAKDFGMFRVTGHGISGEELAEAKAVVEAFFRRLDERKNRFKRSFVEKVGNREEFVWFLSDKAKTLWAREVMGPSNYRDFSYKMESLVNRLDKISEDLAEIFLINSDMRFEKHIQESESIISIYRYSDSNPSILVSNEDSHKCHEYALGLHLATEPGEFFANTNKGPLSFGVDPATIVVTIGDQLVEWSGRDFKCATGEVIFESNIGEGYSYSLELKCSPLNLNFGYTKKNTKKIFIVDQILVLLILTFLYKLLFPSSL